MLCSICGINESVIGVSILYNGKKTDVYLCSECISKFGFSIYNVEKLVNEIMSLINKNTIGEKEYSDVENNELEEETFSFENIENVFSFSKANNFDDNKADQREGIDMKKVDLSCPYCGSTLEEIIESSHLGCIGCLEYFKDRLKHKPARFEGRIPRVYRAIYIRDKLKDYLSSKMRAEVIRENFEEASKIRKIISKIVK
ncbi:MAG: hypothetical protein ABDH28_07890 [Brevinematia bacterium]